MMSYIDQLNAQKYVMKLQLNHYHNYDVASECYITTCIKIDKPVVVYIIAMTSS